MLTFLRLNWRIMPGIAALVLVFYAVIFQRSDLDIEFNKQGATIVTKARELQKATILLPATKLWLNTGLRVKPKQRLLITASGAVNLALHRQMEAAMKHTKPRVGWLGPDGGPYPASNPLDSSRDEFLVLPGANYGTILACIAPEGDILGMDRPRPKGVVVAISKDGISSDDGGILWLCVNDVVLSADAEHAYLAPQAVLDRVYGAGTIKEEDRKKEWNEIKQSRYFDAFFDDNAGEFLIHVDFTK